MRSMKFNWCAEFIQQAERRVVKQRLRCYPTFTLAFAG